MQCSGSFQKSTREKSRFSSSTVTPGDPAKIQLVSGDNQVTTPGATLAPMLFRVTDSYGNVISGVTLNLGGNDQGVTDANGEYSYTRIAETPMGAIIDPVTISGVSGVFTNIHYLIQPGPTFAVTFQTPDNQRHPQGSGVFRVAAVAQDQWNNPIANKTATWKIISGPGATTSGSSQTGATGLASTSIRPLGIGAVVIEVDVEGITARLNVEFV